MDKKKLSGYIYVFTSYLIWGILPIYWKQLSILSSVELLAIRIIMATVSFIAIVYITKNIHFIDYLKNKKTRLQLLLSSFFIAINWGVFIYAVNSGYVVQASLGYYINPLVSVFLGIFILKEKLSKIQYFAIFLALIGVLYMAISHGQFPWISLLLAFSFALYGLLKKLYQLDSLNSLLAEIIFLLPFMIFALAFGDERGQWVLSSSLYEWIFILLAGVVTIVPLYLFSEGAKRIPLSAVGFLQYIEPTLMLTIGVLLYGEAFTLQHGISFGFIWLGLIIYSVSNFTQYLSIESTKTVKKSL
ncbi:EamA family transporter RarD [Clostridium sediminicola]|uniref:EamA family transporter RarD n=1 Tax=Clostridium sediminicola TaxID=3114879 RepID=UPI0031F1F0D2